MSARQLIVASGNPHKAEEFRGLLAGAGFEVCAAGVCGGMPEVDETGATFAENARLKAEALTTRAPAAAWVLADDSGLEVDALGGRPGVRSARYAGEKTSDAANCTQLLRQLQGVEDPGRTARFRCVLCLIGPDGHARLFDGACEGRIAHQPRGAAGFGYDPVFVPQGYDRTFGELGQAVKSRLSHRARAVRALVEGLGSGMPE
jgi:XTP/dITP diphosphohydrolase